MEVNQIVFIIGFAAMIFVSVFTLKGMNMPESKKKKTLRDISYVIQVIMVVTGIFDITNLNEHGIYQGTTFLFALVCVIQLIIMQISERRFEKGFDGSVFRFLSKLITIAAVLELTIFNFHSYQLWAGNYKQNELPLSNAEITNGHTEYDAESGTLKITGKDEVLITYKDVGQTIGTLYADVEFGENTKKSSLILDITDETHESYRYDIAKTTVISGYERDTASIPCQFSGEIGTLRVKFTMSNDNDEITVKSISVNDGIPFDISYARFLGIIIISALVYLLVNGRKMNTAYYQSKSFCTKLAVIVTVIALIAAVKIVSVNSKLETLSDWKNELKQESGNQISMELVDAFEAGSSSLLFDVDEKLLELENPYDWGLRNDSVAEAKWDHVMYNGKYYSYYGIAPVILLFLPYHMITGYYFPTNIAVMLFGMAGIVFLTMTYMTFIKKYFWNIKSNIVISGLIIIQLVSGIWYAIGRTLFYEISISSGFAFVTLGAYFLLSSNVTGGGRVSIPRSALASLFLATAVLCRPTLAVYCISACIFFLLGIPSASRIILDEGSVNGVNKSRRAGYIICAFAPMFILGFVQMYYNYIRFDSPLDFGIQYSLTINDFTHSQYHTNFVLIGLYNYLIAPLSFKLEFPFISTEFTRLDVNGYYFSDTGNTSGILFLALPVFAYFMAGKAYRLADRKTRLKKALLMAVPCIIMPFVIICSIWESGYAVRYTADFSWEIITGAYVIAFFLYSKCENIQIKKLFEKFMAFSVVWSLAVNGFQIFNFAFSEDKFPVFYYTVSNVFEFWR